MARTTERLTDAKVRVAKRHGDFADGGGLYLQVSRTGTRSWLFRYMRAGRERWMGLGPYPDVTLAAARGLAAACRQILREGLDPIERRKAQRLAWRLELAKTMTFQACATAYIAAHKTGWRNEKHATQWRASLDTYAHPSLGGMPVQEIDTTAVLKVLQPIWSQKPETATRVRQRIEAVLDWAIAHEYRAGDNPARWRGHLDKLLPRRSKVKAVVHHVAMPYAELPAFYQVLRRRSATSALAMAFTILTAARSGEVRSATWGEIDLKEKMWTVPAEHTKAQRPHRVPLADEAVSILEKITPLGRDSGSLVFPGDDKVPSGKRREATGSERAQAPMSENTMRKYLQEDLGKEGITVHGFRSSFRDWAAEQTIFPREIVEAALAHVLRDKTEAAYQRGDMLDRRRELMEAWATYCVSGELRTNADTKQQKATGPRVEA